MAPSPQSFPVDPARRRATSAAVTDIVAEVSTRALIITALITGMVILIAFTVQVLIAT